jgi:hypothetical protein
METASGISIFQSNHIMAVKERSGKNVLGCNVKILDKADALCYNTAGIKQ